MICSDQLSLNGDDEQGQLNCETLEEQEKRWTEATKCVDESSIGKLLLDKLHLKLVSFEFFHNSLGCINKLFTVRAVDSSGVARELMLKILDPQKLYAKRKTCEAALINYVRANTSIPVPTILDYCCDSSQSMLNCEYILMDKCEGDLLAHSLPDSSTQLPTSLISELIGYILQLRSLKPPFSADHTIIQCALDELMRPIPAFPSNRVHFKSFFDTWNESIDYYLSEMRKLKCLTQTADLLSEKQKMLNDMLALIDIDKLNTFLVEHALCLNHTDMNASNILVDKRTLKIKCIIDWEWALFGVGDDTNQLFDLYEDKATSEQEYTKAVVKSVMRESFGEFYAIRERQRFLFYLNEVVLSAHLICNYHYIEFRGEKEPSREIRVRLVEQASRLRENLNSRFDQELDSFIKDFF